MTELWNRLTNQADEVLDVKGLACPMPLLKTKQRLNKLEDGCLLAVVTTDKGSIRDFAAFLELTAHRLVEQSQDADNSEYYFLIHTDHSGE